tara:strand:+ start:161850 stop:162434 length:585 start_codon:yes stop_codon:yes gene_type:complete
MTKKEAALFFPYEDSDDLDDLWEERLFEQKQFFLTRPPLEKLFNSRLEKLKKQYLAYLTLKGEDDTIIPINSSDKAESFPVNLIETFNIYHERRNQYKQELLRAQDFATVQNVLHSWLSMEKSYYKKWQLNDSLNDQLDVTKSKEPDPMILLEGLKTAHEQDNIHTFEDLRSKYNQLNEDVRKEVKRLTLLAQE